MLLLPALIAFRPAEAQVRASSQTMQRMLADAGRKNLRIGQTGVQELGALCPGKTIRVEMKDGVLQDAGVVLFPGAIDRDYVRPAYRFIERYLLALLLKRDRDEQRNLLREDAVTLKVNGLDFAESNRPLSLLLQSIDSLSPFRLTDEPAQFRAQWLGAYADIELVFPKQYDLILGRDKKELAEAFRGELETFSPPPAETVYEPLPAHYLPASDLFADLQDTYLIPQMRSGRFMQQKGAAFVHVFSEQAGEESLLNLFSSADEMKRKSRLSLTVKGYRLSEKFPFTADRLCAYMKAHGCKAYMGVETETEKEFTGTVMYVNRSLMCMHLLYFKFPKAAFRQENATISATLYPYIPIHNISTLYEDMNNYTKQN